MASKGAPMENFSRFVDSSLQPSIAEMPSYIQDTTDFINKLWSLPPLAAGSLLINSDASSLYTNIPHKEGVKASEEALNSRELIEPPTADLCQLILFIFSFNSFNFNQKYYPEMHGTVVGTCMATSYSNLFMGRLLQEFLLTHDKLRRVCWR